MNALIRSIASEAVLVRRANSRQSKGTLCQRLGGVRQLSNDTCVSAKSRRSAFGATLTIDDKIKIFSERVDGWQLKPAEAMLKQILAQNPPEMQHAAYALIAVIFSYYEMIGDCLTSRKRSYTGKFIAGFKDVHPALGLPDTDIKDIYGKIRCGMYHVAYTNKGVLIDGTYPTVVTVSSTEIKLNPHLLPPEIRIHFGKFVARLAAKADPVLIQRFERMFDR